MTRPMKRVLLWSASAVVLIVLAAGGFGWYLYHSASQTAAKMYEDIDPVKPVYVSKDPAVVKQPEPVQMKKLEPFNVLVLGVDQRANDRGRSDTMIIMTVNPAKKSILMFNIPRDTRTEIVGHGTVDKINHAYAFGDVQMSINTVENFIDYPIDYFIKVNMEGFASLIDTLGGVEVDNPFAFDYEGVHFGQGHLDLNGTNALLYSRMRYDDPRGDFGRNTRQRDILQEIMKHSLSLSSLTHIQSLLGQLGNSVKTNITFAEMKTFVTDYRPNIDKVDTVEIQGKGQIINKIWYYIVDDKERLRIHDAIRDHLQQGP